MEIDNKFEGVVEVFCVDISRSMWYSQTFPFVVGKSKLQLSNEIIQAGTPLPVDPDKHYSSLVTFCSVPKQVLPFAVHDADQIGKIVTELDTAQHAAGTAIYAAINFCEELIIEFIHHPKRRSTSWKVLLHVFSDGDDNSSDEYRKKEHSTEKEYIRQGDHELHHKFLYSFSSNFEQVSPIGTKIGATVIMVQLEGLQKTIEERDKMVFRFFTENNSNLKKRPSKLGFNVLKGDQPDIVLLHKQLCKADQVFQGAFLKEEGIFRENANVKVAETTAQKLASGMDTLDDYSDPIMTAHAFKNVLRSYTIIPKSIQTKLLLCISQQMSVSDKISKMRENLLELPDKNYDCLKKLLSILHRVAVAQRDLPTSKALTVQGLALIFGPILFEMEEGEDLAKLQLKSGCVAFLLDNRIPLMDGGMKVF